jgi:hypothetical protein
MQYEERSLTKHPKAPSQDIPVANKNSVSCDVTKVLKGTEKEASVDLVRYVP